MARPRLFETTLVDAPRQRIDVPPSQIAPLVFGGMIPLGSLQAGLMADALGTSATIAIGALVCALAAFVTLNVVRKREAQQTASAPSRAAV